MMFRLLYASLLNGCRFFRVGSCLMAGVVPLVGQEHPEGVAVIGGISQQAVRHGQRCGQIRGRTVIASLSGCQVKDNQPPILIGNGVNFGRPSAPDVANCLRLAPVPFLPSVSPSFR